MLCKGLWIKLCIIVFIEVQHNNEMPRLFSYIVAVNWNFYQYASLDIASHITKSFVCVSAMMQCSHIHFLWIYLFLLWWCMYHHRTCPFIRNHSIQFGKQSKKAIEFMVKRLRLGVSRRTRYYHTNKLKHLISSMLLQSPQPPPLHPSLVVAEIDAANISHEMATNTYHSSVLYMYDSIYIHQHPLYLVI